MTPLLGRGTLGGGGAWGTLSSYCSPRKHLDALFYFFGVRGYKLIDAVSGKLFRTGDRCHQEPFAPASSKAPAHTSSLRPIYATRPIKCCVFRRSWTKRYTHWPCVVGDACPRRQLTENSRQPATQLDWQGRGELCGGTDTCRLLPVCVSLKVLAFGLGARARRGLGPMPPPHLSSDCGTATAQRGQGRCIVHPQDACVPEAELFTIM